MTALWGFFGGLIEGVVIYKALRWADKRRAAHR